MMKSVWCSKEYEESYIQKQSKTTSFNDESETTDDFKQLPEELQRKIINDLDSNRNGTFVNDKLGAALTILQILAECKYV